MADGDPKSDYSAEEAVQFLREVAEAETTIRQEAMEDLRFRYGDQWPLEAAQSRNLGDRPKITVNETDAYLRKIENQIREQRPRAKAHPVDSQADPKIAEVVTGLLRHVDENSDASNAYDSAANFALTMGFGYWRLRHGYVREDSFNQDIFIDPVENPFNVYFDPRSYLPDGSDQERSLITDLMPKKAFEKAFPGAITGQFTERATGDTSPDWETKDSIRLAEYFCIDRKPAVLIALAGGKSVFEDEVDPALLTEARKNNLIVGTRPSYKRIVKWCKQTSYEILEKKTLLGRWIPIVPVYGVRIIIDGKCRKFGAVRFARDPAMMVNFWTTALTEAIAMAPKAKWIVAEGQTDGHEKEFARANQDPTPYLTYKPVLGPDGQPVPPPSRMQPEPPPEALIMAAMGASQNLQRVLGMYDPGTRAGAQRKSDKTINAEAQQTEITNFHFYDNLGRSLKHSARIQLDWTPKIWDVQRVQRIIGADGRPKLITLNQKQQGQDPTGNAIVTVLNDVTVGTYDIVMETGPGYNSRRQEGVETSLQLLGTPLGEKIAQVADDIIVREMDFNGADVIADRLAAANPLAQIDEESDVPPKAQMMIKGLQAQVQKMGQALQAAGVEIKFGLKKEEIRQDGETKRELMRSTTKAHTEEQTANWKQHDTEVRAVTQQNVAEIGAIAQLMVKHMDTKALREEIAARDREQAAKDAEEEPVSPT